MAHVLRPYLALQRFAALVAGGFGWLPPALARLTVGWIFFQSGWGKLADLATVSAYFAELGLPAPAFQAAMASTTELVCGGLLLAGLLTRYAAVPLIVVMLVALRTALWQQIDSLGALFGLAEYLYVALLVAIATYGAGPLSLDALLERGAAAAGEAPAARGAVAVAVR